MLYNCESYTQISVGIREEVGAKLISGDVWSIAGDGWRKVIEEHVKEAFINEIDEKFHTPRSYNVKLLLKKYLGIGDITRAWYWQKMSTSQAVKKLNDMITIRGGIAHRVKDPNLDINIQKQHVIRYMKHIETLVEKTESAVQIHVKQTLKK